MLEILGFVATIMVITGLIHFYLYRRLVRDTTARGWARRIGGLAVLGLALLVPLTFIGTRSRAPWLAWPGYLWLAIMFYLLVLLAVLELPLLVARTWLRRRAAAPTTAAVPEPALVGSADRHYSGSADLHSGGSADLHSGGSADLHSGGLADRHLGGSGPAGESAPPPPPPDHNPGRRRLLARGAAIAAGVTAVGLTGYGVTSALGPPVVRRLQIPLGKLARSADGLRIAVVADIHIGPILGRAHTERVVATINGLEADIVAVVGDLVDGTVAELGPAAAPLRDLRARQGSYFVTGNHEYYSGYEQWIEEVRRLGVRPLRNERVELGPLDLAGVNDVTGRQYGDAPDFAAALGDRDPTRPVVLLAHQPIQVHEAARHGVDLQLSGHTHGGQIVPFNLVVGLQQPVVRGLARFDQTQVYVTSGVGFWGPPVRVGVPPEISLIELRAAV